MMGAGACSATGGRIGCASSSGVAGCQGRSLLGSGTACHWSGASAVGATSKVGLVVGRASICHWDGLDCAVAAKGNHALALKPKTSNHLPFMPHHSHHHLFHLNRSLSLLANLLPLNSSGRLGGNVIDYPIHPRYFIDNAVGNAL